MGQLDFAVLGNCQVSALVDKEASYVWAGLPRLDSPALFASLLSDEKAGYWKFIPVSGPFTTHQEYLANTNIVVTTFSLASGDAFEVIDFAPRYSVGPGEYFRPARFLRILRPLRGSPQVRMEVCPMFNYGEAAPHVEHRPDGVTYRLGGEVVHLQATVEEKTWTQGVLLDRMHCFALSHETPIEGPFVEHCEQKLELTTQYWRHWVKHCRVPLLYQKEVIRSALALKLHVFEETGAIIAATTTSIPESPEGGRNWDYRFCWLRDAYFVTHAFGLLERVPEIEGYVGYLQGVIDKDSKAELQPVYGIRGESELVETVIPWLKGFKGYGPVRVGNAAYTHHQYDVYGEVVLAMTPVFVDQRIDHFSRQSTFELVVYAVEKAIEVFDKPDAGIWEMRSEESHFVFSKVMCWAALDRGIQIARQVGKLGQYPHWAREREKMRRAIEEKGWNEELGYYVQHWDGTAADASNLLMDALGFHPHGHERFRRMQKGYAQALLEDGFVFRYRTQDDFGIPRHAFTICSYWYVDFLIGLGYRDEAVAMFERLLRTCNHVGLVSEDVNQRTGELWGNLPQTYPHAGIINTAFRLSAPLTAAELNAPQ